MDEENVKEKLYPILKTMEHSTLENSYSKMPSAPIENDSSTNLYSNIPASNYRLDHIKDIKGFLEQNSEIRRSLSKKYSKLNKTIDYTNYLLNTVTALSGIASVSTLPTLALIPLSLALGGISIGSSALTIILTKLNKKIKNKEIKHRDIYNLSENKLNLIESLLSKALQDETISDEEFQIILNEEKHFRLHKEDIRRNKNLEHEEKVKEAGKKEFKDALLEPINKLVSVIKKK